MLAENPIVPTVELDAEGVQHGHLRLPYSRDDSAWGSVMTPITVVRNGQGPTALLTGGNHGDEYEGPIALQHLAATLSPEIIQGCVIIVPALNYLAFRAARRTSPADNGNLNRLFPGRPDGSVTEKIADYFTRVLVPRADVVLDFHSGGRTLDFLPFAAVHVLEDKSQQAACVAAMHAFNAPYSVMLREIDNIGMYDTIVEEQGKVFVSTELRGGGTVTARSVAIAKKGVHNLLIHAGILDAEPLIERSIDLVMPDDDCYLFSEHDGLFEPAVDLGQPVQPGDAVARIWPLERTGQSPVEYLAERAGLLTGRHFPGLIKSGDCMSMIAVAKHVN